MPGLEGVVLPGFAVPGLLGLVVPFCGVVPGFCGFMVPGGFVVPAGGVVVFGVVPGVGGPTGGVAVDPGGVAVPAGGVAVPAGGVAVPAGGVAVPFCGVVVPAGGVAAPGVELCPAVPAPAVPPPAGADPPEELCANTHVPQHRIRNKNGNFNLDIINLSKISSAPRVVYSAISLYVFANSASMRASGETPHPADALVLGKEDWFTAIVGEQLGCRLAERNRKLGSTQAAAARFSGKTPAASLAPARRRSSTAPLASDPGRHDTNTSAPKS